MKKLSLENNKKFHKIILCLSFFLCIYNIYKISPDDLHKKNVLSSWERSSISYVSSSYSSEWDAINLIVESRKGRGWRSKKNELLPHIIIFELPATAKIDQLKFNNNTEEAKYKGISSKEVKVEFSIFSQDSGYINIGTFFLERSAEIQEYKIQKTKARWIRLSILNNHGNPNYTELMKFETWGTYDFNLLRIISNFIWVLGIAIILSDFSYHEFLANNMKTKRLEVFKRSSFKKPLLLGLVLVIFGLIISFQHFWLSTLLGAIAFLLLIWSIKFIRIQEAKIQEVDD